MSFFKFAGVFERRLRLQFEQMIVVVWHLPAGKMAFRFLVTEVLSFSVFPDLYLLLLLLLLFLSC